MPDLQDGEYIEMQGSGAKPYVLKNTGGVYSCSCPAWRNQSIAIEKRTCKHLRRLRGEIFTTPRIGLLKGCPKCRWTVNCGLISMGEFMLRAKRLAQRQLTLMPRVEAKVGAV
jgi:hypothetical protein